MRSLAAGRHYAIGNRAAQGFVRSRSRLKRNLVVRIGGEIALLAAAARDRATTTAARRCAFERRATFGAAVEHDEFAAEFLQDDFGRVLILPVLVRPLARLQLAFEINL